MKISVILPVYNVEKFLEKSVMSVMEQTYADLEIILVDDGATDSCPELCDKFAERDSRIVVIHKENGGLSDARNAGIEVASGEALYFMDSDDYIEKDTLEIFVNEMQNSSVDMVVGNYRKVTEEGEFISEYGYGVQNPLIRGSNKFVALQEHGQLGPAWNKLCRKQLFDRVRFPKGKYHEDDFVSHQLLYYADVIAVLPDYTYNYVQRQGSIMNTGYSVRRLDGAEAYLERMEFYRKVKSPELIRLVIPSIVEELATAYGKLDMKIESNRARLNELMARFIALCKNEGRYLGGMKWKVALLGVMPKFYYIIVTTIKKIKRGIKSIIQRK